MVPFRNAMASHAHSQETLTLMQEYDTFLESLDVIADMGSGAGLDTAWWATLATRDDPPEPMNYVCYAVDRDISQLDPVVLKNDNVIAIQGNFEERVVPRQIDLLWCHDAFQYVVNPLNTLQVWNQNMNANGMMVLNIQQQQTYQYNRMKTRSVSGCYYNYNICNLIYMLAVNGFDCRDSYFDMKENDPWIKAAVYKSHHAPMDPATTTWHDLADKQLVNDSVIASLNKYGEVRQEELLFVWFDKDWRWARN